MTMEQPKTRRPRAFQPDDPALEITTPAAPDDSGRRAEAEGAAGTATDPAATGRVEPSGERRPDAFSWGAVLVSALTGLAMLGIGAWFARLASAALMRADWVGWTANALLIIAVVALVAIALKELAGLARLGRLSRVRRSAEDAIRNQDARRERDAIAALKSLLSARPELARQIQRFAAHESDVREAGELLRLADRELVAPLDADARRVILAAGKRVATVTALSPMPLIAMAFVLYENLRMLRVVAGVYGGRPGALGAWRLARMVVAHIIATGGVALTDDLLGQFLGQDLLRRLSRRLGEGAFNAALTARIGAAAVEIMRPLPYLEAPRLRARDLASDLLRGMKDRLTRRTAPP